jgi:hypothetical protein
MSYQVKVSLSQPQLRKLINGHAVQIAAAHLNGGNIPLMLEEANYKKVLKAQRSGKGVRIAMSPSEIEASGIKDWLKKAWNKIKPIFRGALKQVVHLADNVPLVGELSQRYGDKAVDSVGDKTGAYGLRQYVKPAKRGRKSLANGGDVSDISAMMHPDSSMLYRPQIMPPNGQYASCPHCGGSFKGAVRHG